MTKRSATPPLLLAIEEARRRVRLSQREVALRLDMSQGHYSKLVTAKVPLTDAVAVRLQDWLDRQAAVPNPDDNAARIHALAASIRRECMELMQLVGLDAPELGKALPR